MQDVKLSDGGVGVPHIVASEPGKKKPKRKKAPHVMGGLTIALAIVGGVFYLMGRGHQTTDDAHVDGHMTNIASRIGGRVEEVLVEDNQVVEAGTPIVELEKDELEARVAAAQADQSAAQAGLKSAKAQLAIAEASADSKRLDVNLSAKAKRQPPSVSVSRATLDQMQAESTSARSRLKLAQSELQRAVDLRRQRVISTAEFDTRQAAYDQARAAFVQSEARLTSARIGNQVTAPAQVEAAQAAVDLALARVAQADAAATLADVNLDYASLTAPVRGVVSRRTVEVGQVVAPGSPLLAIVPQDNLWVTANFKEDQIAQMLPGQVAHVKIDSFGSRQFKGTVESLASSTGSKFALLPPDNASGNFVKVVQRVPVRVRIEPSSDIVLRPGMSAEVKVDTGLAK